jgi:hypothetical protein
VFHVKQSLPLQFWVDGQRDDEAVATDGEQGVLKRP